MTNFRTGQLLTSGDFLPTVPRSAMIAALRHHVAQADRHGPIVTTHEHDGLTFHLETDAERTKTAIRLCD